MTKEEVNTLLVQDAEFLKLPEQEQDRIAQEAYALHASGSTSPTATVSRSQNIEQAGVGPSQQPANMAPVSNGKKLGAELLGAGAEVGGAVAGGMRGAAIGSRVGAPLGPLGAFGGGLVGGMIGAGIGGGAGAGVRTGYEFAAGMRPDLRAIEGLRPNLLPQEIGRDVMHGAKVGALGELEGRGLIGLVNRGILGPLGRAITGSKMVTPEDLAVAERAERMGVTLRPAEVSRSDVAAQYEQNTARSLFGKGQFQARDIANEKALSSYIERKVQEAFGRPETIQDAGRTIQDIIQGQSIPAWKAVRDEAYRAVAESVRAPVQTADVLPLVRSLKNAVDEKLYPKSRAILDKIEQEITQPGPVTGMNVKRVVTPGMPEQVVTGKDIYGAPTQATVPSTPEKLKGLAIRERSEAPRQPRELTFQEAVDLRSYLLAIGREAGENLPSRAQGLAGKLGGIVDQKMAQAAKASGPNAYESWRAANKIVKDGHELFDSATIQNLVKANPEAVVANLFKKNALTANERVMAALKDLPEGQRVYRNAAMQKVLQEASSEGFLNGQKFYNALFGKKGVGEDVLRRVYPPGFVDELKETAQVATRMNLSTLPSNAGNPSQTGRSLINWFEQGMIVNIPADFLRNAIQGKFGEAMKSVVLNSAQTGTYVVTQQKLAAILNSPEGLRILRQGMSMSPASEGATRTLSQLLSMATGQIVKSKDKEQLAPPMIPTTALTSPVAPQIGMPQ